MLARHRQSLILQAVRSDGSARVSDLTQQLGVSDMTVRRDLEALARDGLIEKVHGGAVLPGTPTSSHEPGFDAKSVRELPEKAVIAKAAARLVSPGAAIALSAGTTTYALAEQLFTVPGLTVVTNSMRVANLFQSTAPGDHAAPPTSIVLTGGVRTPSEALVGPIADLAIRSLHFDLLFLGCHGIDPGAGLTTPNLAENSIDTYAGAAPFRSTVIQAATAALNGPRDGVPARIEASRRRRDDRHPSASAGSRPRPVPWALPADYCGTALP